MAARDFKSLGRCFLALGWHLLRTQGDETLGRGVHRGTPKGPRGAGGPVDTVRQSPCLGGDKSRTPPPHAPRPVLPASVRPREVKGRS